MELGTELFFNLCFLSGLDISIQTSQDMTMIQGLSGFITGPVDGEPYKCGAAIADLVAGMIC